MPERDVAFLEAKKRLGIPLSREEEALLLSAQGPQGDTRRLPSPGFTPISPEERARYRPLPEPEGESFGERAARFGADVFLAPGEFVGEAVRTGAEVIPAFARSLLPGGGAGQGFVKERERIRRGLPEPEGLAASIAREFVAPTPVDISTREGQFQAVAEAMLAGFGGGPITGGVPAGLRELGAAGQALKRGVVGAGRAAEAAAPTLRRAATEQAGFARLGGEAGEEAASAKEPWQMTRAEFDRQALFRGVTPATQGGRDTYWANRLSLARMYAAYPDSKIRISLKQDVPIERFQAPGKKTSGSVDEIIAEVDEIIAENEHLGAPGIYIDEGQLRVRAEVPANIEDIHKLLVQRAIAEGNPVPTNVLAEYPDLRGLVREGAPPSAAPAPPQAALPGTPAPPPPPSAVLPPPPPAGSRRVGNDFLEGFDDPAMRLIGETTRAESVIRRVPGLRQVYNLIDPAAIHFDEPAAHIGMSKEVFKETQGALMKSRAGDWYAEARGVFRFNRKGVAQGVRMAPDAGPAGKLDRTILDIVERPERYILTQPQQASIARARSLMDSMLAEEKLAGVPVEEVANYWHRSVTGGPKSESALQSLIGRAGTGSGFRGHTRGRYFQFAEDTVEAGYTVNPDPLQSLQRRLVAGVDAIAEREALDRVAVLPGTVDPKTRIPESLLDPTRHLNRSRRSLQSAERGILALQRARRGEQLPASTIEAFERVFPEVSGQLPSASGNRKALDELLETVRGKPVRTRNAQGDLVTTYRGGAIDRVRAEVAAAQREVKRVRPAIEAAKRPRMGETEVLGRIVPEDLARELDTWLELPGRRGPRSATASLAGEAFQLWRSVLVSLDLSATYIQGQIALFRNPAAWLRANALSVRSVVDQPFAYWAKNADLIDDGILNGAIVPPSEFILEGGGRALVQKVPVLGPAVIRTNRAFEWFIFVGQTELYKAAVAGGGKSVDELVSLSSAIRKQLGTESYAISGITRKQRMIESLAAFAPRFYRAQAGLMAQAATPGPGGAEARRAIGSMLAGATALTVGVHYLTTGRAPNFTDPSRSDFGKAKITGGRDMSRGSYIPFYGPWHSLFRTQARVAQHLIQGEPGAAAEDIGFYAFSKASLPLRALKTGAEIAVTGESQTFEGEPIDATPQGLLNFLGEQAPMGPAQIASGIAENKPEKGLEFVGVNVTDTSFSQKRDAAAQRLYGKDFEALTDAEQKRVYADPEMQKPLEDLPDVTRIQDLRRSAENSIALNIQEGQPDVESRETIQDLLRLSRVNQIKDAGVRALVEEYQAAQPLLGRYFGVMDERIPPEHVEIWAQYKRAIAAGDALGAKLMAVRYPHVRGYAQQEKLDRQRMRIADREVDAALVRWYGHAPQHPQNKVDAYRQSRERVGAR